MSALCQKRTLHRADRRLIFYLEIALNQVGNFQIVTFSSLAQAFRNAELNIQLAVLAHLPFALNARDGKAEAYDAAQHGIDVRLRRVRKRPRPGSVLHHFWAAVRMYIA